MLGLLLLLGGSLVLGLVVGQMFFRLFQSTVPPMALGAFQAGAAHAAHLTYGAALGVVVFGWVLLALVVSPIFRESGSGPKVPTSPSPR
jgi:cytochrome b561